MTLTITCRKPSDLIGAAIGVLGFVPSESVVMLTFAGGPRFHARIDLDRDHQLVTDSLLAPVLQHGVKDVAFLVFTDDETNLAQAALLIEQLVADFAARDVNTKAPPLVVIGETVHHRDGTTERCDWRTSPATAALVAQGRRIEPHRDSLKDRLLSTSDALIHGPQEVATLLLDLLDGDKRDNHVLTLYRDDAREQVEHWLAITRQATGLHAAAPSAIAGLAAWLSGDGALAWVCVDHAQQADPDNRLAALLTEALTRCVDPSTWDELRRDLC